ncbi:MAG: hypothetical protein WC389_22535 [Lutibacter sp.]|jgi:hypothetical protein
MENKKVDCYSCEHCDVCRFNYALNKLIDTEFRSYFVIDRHKDNKEYGDGISRISDLQKVLAGACLFFKKGISDGK